MVTLLIGCVLLNSLQQTVGLPFVSLRLEHNLREGGWLRKVLIASIASLTLLGDSGISSGVDHPSKDKTMV
jgi:hypothetical protein